jgi:hypothetical protein
MNGLPFNVDLKLSEGKHFPNGYSSTNHLANARLTSPEIINTALTYAYGKPGGYYSDNSFPMLFNLEGKGRKRAINSVDNSYYSRMFGKPRTTDYIARKIPNQGERVGEAGSLFKIVFKSKFFMRNQMISTGAIHRQVQCHVYGDPEMDAVDGWVYTLKLVTNKLTDYVPSEYLKTGTTWSPGVVKVSAEKSRGTDNEHPSTPYMLQNQLSIIRQSYNIAGNAANKKMTISFKGNDGKSYNMWEDWSVYLNQLKFKRRKNYDLIFSKYNKLSDGSILNIDSDTGEVVRSGMGVWDMIPNSIYYSKFSFNKLDESLSTMFQNNNIAGNQNSGDYVFYAGSGLLKEVDKALKNKSSSFLTLSDKFVRGTDTMNLEYGAYFTSFRHHTGKTIKFVYDPAFDFGEKADAAPRHPLDPTRSSLSYCGMAMDFSDVEIPGQKSTSSTVEPNILMTYEEGREYKEWLVLGGADMPMQDIEQYKSRATDIDASAMHVMCSQGAHINYPNSCSKLICNINGI